MQRISAQINGSLTSHGALRADHNCDQHKVNDAGAYVRFMILSSDRCALRSEEPETCSGCLKSVINTNASQFLEKNEDHNYQARQNW